MRKYGTGKLFHSGRGRLITAALIWCALMNNPLAADAFDLASPAMPKVVKANGKLLVLNGTAIGTKIFLRVYTIGLYLEKKTTDAETAIKSDESKRISLVMLRSVSRQQFVQAVEKGIVRNCGVPMASLRSRLDLLEKELPSLAKGDMLDFTYVPAVGTVVRGQGRELKIPGKDFAEALFSVWLGPHSDNGSLRDKLLGSS